MSFFLYSSRGRRDLVLQTEDRVFAERMALARGLELVEPSRGRIAQPHWRGLPCRECGQPFEPRRGDGTMPAHYRPTGGRPEDRCPGEDRPPALGKGAGQ